MTYWELLGGIVACIAAVYGIIVGMEPIEHEARPSPDGMASGVFTTCAECAVPVWRPDAWDIDPSSMGWTSLDQGTWEHVDVGEDS